MEFLILALLGLMHTLADYTHLSTKWMLQAKMEGKPILPIMAHAGVHAVLFTFVALFFGTWWQILLVFLIQFGCHFGIDFLKGKMNVWFPTLKSTENKFHWYVFGADQYLHYITILLCTFILK